jgi:hypothetical protein
VLGESCGRYRHLNELSKYPAEAPIVKKVWLPAVQSEVYKSGVRADSLQIYIYLMFFYCVLDLKGLELFLWMGCLTIATSEVRVIARSAWSYYGARLPVSIER